MDREKALIQRFRDARRDPALVVLEGFHPLKHALRFGAEVLEVVAVEQDRIARLADALGPDIAERLRHLLETVSPEVFDELTPLPPATGILALARRPVISLPEVLAAPGAAPVLFLEQPMNLFNVGAAIRVAAAADAAALLTTGPHDPWHPNALRGAAGLQFALPVARVEALPALGERPLVAIDPEGEPLTPGALPPRAILAFGSERHGLSPALREQAERRIRIPMREGVSSLNLATAVAVVLYAAYYGRG
jgi:TrmH family RNA methyltransferase